MKEQELFAAIGGVEVRFLEEVEQPKVRRLPKYFGLIAALVALLLTACAAPVVVRNFAAVKNGSIVESERDMVMEKIWKDKGENPVAHIGPDVYYTSGQVSLAVETSPDAPETIEECYLPVKLLEYCNVENWSIDDTVLSVELSMDTTKNRRVYSIFYQQQTLPEEGLAAMDGVLGNGFWQERESVFGEITAMEFYGRGAIRCVDLKTGKELHGRNTLNESIRHVFWSDGMYLYGMRLISLWPLNGTASVEDILDSLTAVDDLDQYLPKTE